MTIGSEEPGDPRLPDEAQRPLARLREGLNRRCYPGQAWPRRRHIAAWKWVAAAAAVVALAAGVCFLKDAVRPAPQPVAVAAAEPVAQEPFLVTIPLSSGLDPWMGGGMPNETLAVTVLVDPNPNTKTVAPAGGEPFIQYW